MRANSGYQALFSDFSNGPGYEAKVLDIQILWTELLELNTTFSKPPEEICEDDISKFETDARNWCRKFLTITNITPYIHDMANHVGEFMRVHGSILPFTQQGLEKYNDMMTNIFMQLVTGMMKHLAIQIIQKQNRLELSVTVGLWLQSALKLDVQTVHKLVTTS